MDDDRTQGVTEARFALTLVICGLVAIGYVVLLRLGGGSNHSAIEILPDVIAQPSIPADDPIVPRVLPVDEPNSVRTVPAEIAKRPEISPNSGPSSAELETQSNSEAQRR